MEWIALVRAGILASVLAGSLTFAFVKGGELERIKHANYVIEQKEVAVAAREQWQRELAQLQAEVSAARALSQTAVRAADAADQDANRRIDEAVAAARSAPMDVDVVARINAIVDEANR